MGRRRRHSNIIEGYPITEIELPKIKQTPTQLLSKMFETNSAISGGVVRRKKTYADKYIGGEVLKNEVQLKGFHMFSSGGQYVVICNSGDLKIVC